MIDPCWAWTVVLASGPVALELVHASQSAQEQRPAPVTAEEIELSLEQVLKLALERNLELAVGALASDAAAYRATGSWGAFDPVFNLNLSIEDSETEASSDLEGASVIQRSVQTVDSSVQLPFTSGGDLTLSFQRNNNKTNSQFAFAETSTTDTVALSFTQPLLRGAWRRFATVDQRESELGYLRTQLDQEVLRLDLVFRVRSAYWNLVAAREELAVREFALRLGREQLEQEQRRLEVGVGTQVDVLQAETNVAQQEEQRLQAYIQRKAALDAVRALIHPELNTDSADPSLDWQVEIVPSTALPEVPLQAPLALNAWSEAFARAQDQRPDLARQRLEIESADLRIARAESDKQAALDLTLALSATGFDGQTTEAFESATQFEFPTARATLSYSLPIGNRSALNNERAARTDVRAARLRYDKLELDILVQVRTAVRDLNYLAEAVRAAQKSSELAERQFAAEQARQSEGVSTTFQVLQFQQQLSQALSTLSAARANYAKAQAALDQAVGGDQLPRQL